MWPIYDDGMWFKIYENLDARKYESNLKWSILLSES